MAKKITWRSGEADEIVFAQDEVVSEYFINYITGLDSPDTSIQSQTAPDQDGTTYIDSRYRPRIIEIQGAIAGDFTLAEIETKRRELISKIQPKDGIGWIKLEIDGQTMYAKGVPQSAPKFTWKYATDGFQRFMVRFYCADPYLYGEEVTETITGLSFAQTGALPVSVDVPTMVVFGNDTFVVSSGASGGYARDKFAYSTDSGTTWTETTAPASANWEYLVFAYDRFFAFQEASTTSATYSLDGITWNAMTMPSAGNWHVAAGCDGIYVAVKYDAGTTAAARSTDGSTWSAMTMPTIGGSDNWKYVIYGNGYFVAITYDGYFTKSLDGITWSALVNYSEYTFYSISYVNNEFFISVSTVTSDWGFLHSSDLETWTFSLVDVVPSIGSLYVKIGYINGMYFTWAREGGSYVSEYIIYSKDLIKWGKGLVSYTAAGAGFGMQDAPAYNDSIILNIGGIFTSLPYYSYNFTPESISISGDVSAPVEMKISGAGDEYSILCNDEYISIDYETLDIEDLYITTGFGNKRIYTKTSDGSIINRMNLLKDGSMFFNLDVGTNYVFFINSTPTSSPTLTITYRPRYLGV